ncbi:MULTISPECIES: type III-B CRISPR module-associated protein Cmr5 [unclassified Methanoculleus]|jgi:CRISPR-associated protein Cmr5|uniref:type III-B CRISPR module-associated protein Cmr5 n=1 Tax=unclassified Methanoculleus TaxID=2619537 RepID=UPI00316AD8F6
MQTRQQKRAERAHRCVLGKTSSNDKDDYLRLAKSFPALVHTCGLVQAIAYVHAKDDKTTKTGDTYLGHLSQVMVVDLPKNITLEDKSREADLIEYQHLSLEAIEAATWLKRYAEALLDRKRPGQPGKASPEREDP